MKILSPLVALLLLAGCGGEITDIANLADVEIYTVIGGCPDDLGASVGCVSTELPPDTPPPDQEGGCWITGIGHIGSDLNLNGISDKPGAGKANQDSFGGNAKGFKAGFVKGQWQNTTHLADGKHKFHGVPNFLYCWNDGGPGPDVPKAYPNRAIWAGPGKWDHQDGYVFIASAADYKEGKDGADANIRDAYAITVYKDENGDGVATLGVDTVVYEESDCVYGNFQIHPPNNGHPYIPATPTAAMDDVRNNQDLCPGPDPNW